MTAPTLTPLSWPPAAGPAPRWAHRLLHAIADFVTADGTRLEGKGVVPDEIVKMDRKALAEGRDPVLAAALAWIDRQR